MGELPADVPEGLRTSLVRSKRMFRSENEVVEFARALIGIDDSANTMVGFCKK